jgi:hypothetical protein
MQEAAAVARRDAQRPSQARSIEQPLYQDAGQKTGGALNRPANQFRLRSLSGRGVHVLFEADRNIDLRLTKNPSKPAGKQPGECTREHASDQKRPSPSR